MPNVKLLTNVICKELRDENGDVVAQVNEQAIAKRLTYFELRGLNRAMPFQFSKTLLERDALTREQRNQIDAWLREETGLLWPQIENYSLPYSANDMNPFVAEQGGPFGGPEAAEVEQAADSDPGPGTPVNEQIESSTPPRGQLEPENDTKHAEVSQEDTEPDTQAIVVQLPPEQSALVLAPPGTGKTHLLVERLVHLLESDAFANPADEMVVLSFTRAAVTEVANRVESRVRERSQDNLRYVNVRTFDSFADKTLRRKYEHHQLARGEYEARIKQLVDEIAKNDDDEIGELIGAVRYLIVDEIQDLSGIRGELVISLIDRVTENGGAVLLLGDPCQAIYDWNLKKNPDGLTSQKFLAAVMNLLDGKGALNEYKLSKYWRYQNEQTLYFINKAREAMGDYGDQPDGLAISRLLASTSKPHSLSDIVTTAQASKRTGILTRSNLQAFQISQWLSDRGIEHELSQGSAAKGWPAWVARLLSGWKQDKMRLETLAKRYARIEDCDDVESYEKCLEFLSDVGVVGNGSIDIYRLSYLVANQRPPIEKAGSRNIVVSTIHKSKGLEYDNVFLVAPNNNMAGDPEEIRVAYVGATRAREQFRLMENDKTIFSAGRKSGEHFILRSKRSSRVLLTGYEEILAASCLPGFNIDGSERSVEGFRSRQASLWQKFHEGNLVCSARLVEIDGYRRLALFARLGDDGQETDEFVTFFSQSLYGDIKRELRLRSSQEIEMPSIPISHLQTVGFPDDDYFAEEYMGLPRMAFVPVPNGLADVEIVVRG